MPYILTKFFEKKSYQEDFIKGNFYLSSLATFTKTYAERGLMEAAAQGDRYAKVKNHLLLFYVLRVIVI